jgi:hypothetical protein
VLGRSARSGRAKRKSPSPSRERGWGEGQGYTHTPVVHEVRVVGVVGKDKILNVLRTAGVISG